LFIVLLLINKSKTRIGLQHLRHYHVSNFYKNWRNERCRSYEFI